MALAAQPSTALCPVAPLVPQMVRAIRQHAQFAMLSADLQDAAYQRMRHIEDAVPHLRATSQEGVQLQVMVAYGLVDWLFNDFVPEDKIEAAMVLREQIDNCLLSAALALRTVDTAPLFDWFMTRLLEKEEAA